MSCNSVGISCCAVSIDVSPGRFCQNVSDLLFPLEEDLSHLEQPGKEKQGTPQLTLLTPALYNASEVSCGDLAWVAPNKITVQSGNLAD